MKTVWTKGLTSEEEIEQRKEALAKAKYVLGLLDKMLDEKKHKALSAVSPDHMDSGWPYRCADINGYLRAVEEIKSLIQQE